jgi:hypothetical protein
MCCVGEGSEEAGFAHGFFGREGLGKEADPELFEHPAEVIAPLGAGLVHPACERRHPRGEGEVPGWVAGQLFEPAPERLQVALEVR